MKTLIKLVVAALVLNAAGRAGWAALNYYQLRDAAQQAVTFGAQEPPAGIQTEIMKKAVELKLPVEAKDVRVTRQGIRTQADLTYTDTVEVFPRYEYPVTLSFKVDAVSLTG